MKREMEAEAVERKMSLVIDIILRLLENARLG
jgi:hypothetical protein